MPWQTPTGTIDGIAAPTLACAGPVYDELVAADRFVQVPLTDYTPPGGSSLAFLWVLPATALVRVKSRPAHDPNRINWETPLVSADTLPVLTFTRPVYQEWLAIDRLLQAPSGVDYIQIAPNKLQLLWSPPPGAIIRASYDVVPYSSRVGWERPRGTLLAGVVPDLQSAVPIISDEVFAVDGMVQIPGLDYAPGGTDLGQATPVPPNATLALLYDTTPTPGTDTAGVLVHRRDVAADATSKILQQYRDATAPGVREQVQTNAAEVQQLEDAAWSIIDNTAIDSPTTLGVNLDVLGKIVGRPRSGLDDTEYLVWLKAQIKVNRSSGSIDDILEIFELINPGAVLKFVEQFPAAFALQVHGIAVEAPSIQAAILRVARKAGVRGVLEYSTAPTGSGFTFAGGDGKGFPDASLTPGSGGKLAGAAI